MRAPDHLESGAATFRERNKIYGDNYLNTGKALVNMFPNGITLKTERDFDVFVAWLNCALKMLRFSSSLSLNGTTHMDSAHDLMVYSSMLCEVAEMKDSESSTDKSRAAGGSNG